MHSKDYASYPSPICDLIYYFKLCIHFAFKKKKG